MKLGDPPAFPTPIVPCPSCKKKEGWTWVWSKSMDAGDGYSVCVACKKEFH